MVVPARRVIAPGTGTAQPCSAMVALAPVKQSIEAAIEAPNSLHPDNRCPWPESMFGAGVIFHEQYNNINGMVSHMKTTLNIDDTVMQRLREEAARRGTTMSALVEAGLRRVLSAPALSGRGADVLPPLPTWRSGGIRVDVADREELYRLVDGV